VLLDDGTLRGKYGITSVPYTLVLRPDGRANNALLGTQAPATLQGAIARRATAASRSVRSAGS